MDNTIKFQRTINRYLLAGACWALVSTILGLINQNQLYLQVSASGGALSYGILRPIYTNTLIFGALLSLFMGLLYYIVQKAGKIELKWEWLGTITFLVHQLAVVLGVLTICTGYSTGREYGEMSFLSDKLLILVLVLFIVTILVGGIGREDSMSTPVIYAIITMVGAVVVYNIGNIALPFSPLAAVHINAGLPDASAQEFYRIGVLGFFIVLPAFAALYYFVPDHFRNSLYSNSMARLQAVAMLVLFSLAGSAWMAYTPSTDSIHSMGIVATIVLAIVTLMGFMNLFLTVNRGGDLRDNDTSGKIIRAGLLFLLIFAFIRAALAPRTMQAWSGYTWLNPLDISLDAQTYGAIIMLGLAGILAERLSGGKLDEKLNKLFFLLSMVGVVLMLAGNVVHGFVQAQSINQIEGGALAVTDWASIVYAGHGNSGDGALASGYYIKSFRAIFLTGLIAMAIAVAVSALNIFKTVSSRKADK